MQGNSYYLVKFLDQKWAEKMLDGEIFMRSIACFGDLVNRSADADNKFRGDTLEGFSRSFGSGVGLIDVLTYREKLYCMYALEYAEITKRIIPPDPRIKDFGDTAVVIGDPMAFLERICSAMYSRFGNEFWTSFMRVKYDVDWTANRTYSEFSKSADYSWQNEFRIVLDLALGKFHPKVMEAVTDCARMTFPGEIVIDTNPDSLADSLVLNIGDIRDICVAIPTTALIFGDDPDSILPNGFPPPSIINPLIVPRQPKPTFFRIAMKLP